MEAEDEPISKPSDQESVWGGAMRARLAQLRAVPHYCAPATYPDAASLSKEEEALKDRITVSRERRRVEIKAIKAALQAVSDHYEEEDSRLSSALHGLATRRNDWAPIMRLSPDVFATILSFLVIADPPCGEELHTLGWIKVTHVCRRWRHASLGLPLLWTNLSFCMSLSCLQVMLSRAKTAPLHFSGVKQHGDGGSRLHEKEFRFIADNLHKTKSISIQVHVDAAHQCDSLTYLTKPAPLLESLDVQVFMDDNNRRAQAPASLYSPSSQFPPDFLGGCTPMLRHVDLYTPLCLPWTSPFLSNLDRLIVQQVDQDEIPPHHVPALGEILGALGNMRAIRCLQLEGISQASSALCSDDIVSLPHLEKLILAAPMDAARQLLQHLTISSAASVSLYIDSPFALSSEITSLYSDLISCRNPGQSQVLSVRMIGPHEGQNISRIYARGVDDKKFRSHVFVGIRYQDSLNSLPQGFDTAFIVPWISEHLKKLEIGHVTLNSADFETLVRATPNVHFMRILDVGTLALFFSLPWGGNRAADAIQADESSGPRGPILSSLSKLKICGLGKGRRTLEFALASGSTRHTPSTPSLGEQLTSWVSGRVAAGFPLAKLDLREQSVSGECLDALQIAAPDLKIVTTKEDMSSIETVPP